MKERMRQWLIKLLGGVAVPRGFETLSYRVEYARVGDRVVTRVYRKSEPQELILFHMWETQ